MKTILCLGAGKSQVPFIEEIKHRGVQLILVDKEYCSEMVQLADIFIHESTYNTDAVLNQLKAISLPMDIIAMVARVSGPALYTAAAISNEYHLGQLSSELSIISTVKSKLRNFCHHNKIDAPFGIKANAFSLENIQKIANGNPIVIKPDLPIVGKKDVVIAFPHQLSSDIFERCLNSSYNQQVEIEQFIDGFDVSCLFLIENGTAQRLCLWDELVGICDSNQITGLGISMPSVIESNRKLLTHIQSIIDKIAASFSNINAFLVLSFRITSDNEVYVIELHCDLSGDAIAEKLLPNAIENFNFFQSVLNYYLNELTINEPLKIKTPTLVLKTDNKYQIVQRHSLKENMDYLVSSLPQNIIMPKHIEYLN